MGQLQEGGLTTPKKAKTSGCLKVFAIIVSATVIASVTAVLIVKHLFFPSDFKPVILNPKEEKILTQKIEQLNTYQSSGTDAKKRLPAKSLTQSPYLEPERYTEDDAVREIEFSEKEFNALIAKNTDLADKMAVDFSGDLASMKLLVPLDPEFPILGGKTLKVTAGVELAYATGKPIVKLKGVSLWGVPLPNAWLGNMKNVDLVNEFGGEKGFWNTFASGIEEIKVEEGYLRVKLKP